MPGRIGLHLGDFLPVEAGDLHLTPAAGASVWGQTRPCTGEVGTLVTRPARNAHPAGPGAGVGVGLIGAHQGQ